MGDNEAVGVWKTVRYVRLRQLAEKMGTGGGATPTEVGMLYVALAAEFQGFCRDLYIECVEDFLDQMVMAPSGLSAALSMTLRNDLALNRHNASAATVAQDFRALGLSPWESVQRRYAKDYPDWRAALDSVNAVRNAVAHSNAETVEEFAVDGKLTNATWAGCLNGTDNLVVALHAATAADLRELAFHTRSEDEDS